MCALQGVTCMTYLVLFAIDNLTVSNTSLRRYDYGFVPTIPLMATFDPENMRIMGHALRIIGTFFGNYTGNFENLRTAL